MTKKKKTIFITIGLVIIFAVIVSTIYQYKTYKDTAYIFENYLELDKKENPEIFKEKEKKIITEYGDEFVLKTQLTDTTLVSSYHYEVYYDNIKVVNGSCDNENIEIKTFYNRDELRSYKILNDIIYINSYDEKFSLLEDEFNQEVKPLYYEMLKNGETWKTRILFEQKDPTAINIIKEYAKGDFSNSNVSGYAEEILLKRDAQDIIEKYNIE
ncbi:hypothetical protein AGMMS50284_5970 [Clostridia bacterium]|nr:hypothetical protein AGMMS50284_5970 [Clostridia bacterium]